MDDILQLIAAQQGDFVDTQSLIAALRKQQMAGQALQILGDKKISGVGGSLAENAQQDAARLQAQMIQAPQQRMRMALEQQQIAKGQADMAEAARARGQLQDPNSMGSVLRRKLLGKFGMPVANTTAGSDIDEKLIGLAEKGYGVDENSRNREALAKLRAMAAGGGTVGGTPPLKPGQIEKLWGELDNEINPSKGRSGELGKNMSRINGALRLEQLIKTPDGRLRDDMDSREMTEFAIGLQGMLAAGGHSVAEVEHLTPKTVGGDFAKIQEWLTSEPKGAGQRAFVEKMSHTLEREKHAALESLQAAQYGVLPRFAPVAKADRKRFDAILRGQRLDPALLDESLVYQPPGASASSGMVDVVSPEGTAGKVPANKLDAALKRGFKRAP